MPSTRKKTARASVAMPKTVAFKVKGVVFKLLSLPAGAYYMGSPAHEPRRSSRELRHKVTLTRPFLMGQTPVTQELFKAVMGRNPSFFKGPKMPVEQVSWNTALEFCLDLSEMAKHDFRLPTEAEWEFACRAGTKTAFHFGSSVDSTLANFDGGSPYGRAKKGRSIEKTTPVGSYPANPWGFYDMHGNVWEWCNDFLGNYSREPAQDPCGPSGGDERIVRGGSWGCDGERCRSASRNSLNPWFERSTVGFRLAADP